MTDLTADRPIPPPRATLAGQAKRIVWLDRAKGIGICLVVLGHALGGLIDAGTPPGGATGARLFASIYTFHMPLFFFLSSLLVPLRIEKSKTAFATSLARDIAWPYFLWGLLQSFVILSAGSLLNHPASESPVEAAAHLFWQPPSQFWFLYVLFVLHLTMLAVSTRLKGLALALSFCLVGLLLRRVEFWTVLPLTGSMMFWYGLGAALQASGTDRLLSTVPKTATLLLGFALLAVLALTGPGAISANLEGLQAPQIAQLAWAPNNAFLAVLGLAVVLLIARHAARLPGMALGYLGRRSMVIYILHILSLAPLRIALLHFQVTPLLVLVACIVFGIAAPLLFFEAAARLGLTRWIGLGRA